MIRATGRKCGKQYSSLFSQSRTAPVSCLIHKQPNSASLNASQLFALLNMTTQKPAKKESIYRAYWRTAK